MPVSQAQHQRHPLNPTAAEKDLLDASTARVLTDYQLRKLIRARTSSWGIPPGSSIDLILAQLQAAQIIRRIEFRSTTTDTVSKPFTRYAVGLVSPFAVALSLRSSSYLSHASAVFLHGLTDSIPRTIYVNKEQTEKPKGLGTLTQDSINRAFANRQRISRFEFQFDDYRVLLLSGKQTGNLEVSNLLVDDLRLPVTKLERTLIDIAVRPVYAGGIFEVARAYERAAHRVSIATLTATLRSLDYTYPYHQAIGFYLQRAGMDLRKLERLRAMGSSLAFPLGHQIVEPQLDTTWNVCYPRGL